MTLVVTMAGQKGGAGKSTIAICVAAEAIERGLSVLLVDADSQGTARTWGAVAAEASRRAPTVVTMGADMHEGRLVRASKGFDVTLIDCPGRDGETQRSALLAASIAIIPCGPSAADAWALSGSLKLVGAARDLRPDLKACILITRKQARTAIGKGARGVLAESGFAVLQTELGYRVAYEETLAAGQGVTTYAPRGAAAREVRALVDELLGMS